MKIKYDPILSALRQSDASEINVSEAYRGVVLSDTAAPTGLSKGDWVWCSETGTYTNYNNISAEVGNVLVYNGSVWEKIPMTVTLDDLIDELMDDIGYNRLPVGVQFNSDSNIVGDKVGDFDFYFKTGSVELHDGGVKIIINDTSNIRYLTNSYCSGLVGKMCFYSFDAKKFAAEESSELRFALGEQTPSATDGDHNKTITLTEDWVNYSGYLLFGGSEIINFMRAAGNEDNFAVRNFSLRLADDNNAFTEIKRVLGIAETNKSDIGTINSSLSEAEADIDLLNERVLFYTNNIVPEDDRFDETVNGLNDNWSKSTGINTSQYDGGVRVQINGDGNNYKIENYTILDINDVNAGDVLDVEIEAKILSGSYSTLFLTFQDSSGLTVPLNSTWTKVRGKVTVGSLTLNRIAFLLAPVSTNIDFVLRNLAIAKNELTPSNLRELQNFKALVEDTINTTLSGKKLSIIGDSISAAGGSNMNAYEKTILTSDIGGSVAAYVTYHDFDAGLTIGGYTVQESDVGTQVTFSPVSGDEGKVIGRPLPDVSSALTKWWYILSDHYDMTVLQNVSWAGSSYSSHENDDDNYKIAHAWHPATINKLSKRDVDGNAINPDIVIIYRGINDFSHGPYTKLTDFGTGSTAIPTDDTVNVSDFGFKEAIALTVNKIRQQYTDAIVILCTMHTVKRVTYDHFPTRNTEGTMAEYNDAIREIANYMGCALIEFDKCGLTFENIDSYSSDGTHPDANGQLKLAAKSIKELSMLNF